MHSSIQTALSSASIIDNALSFPEPIDKKVYGKLKKMLTDIRGVWHGGKSQCFTFDFDPTSIIDDFISTSNWPKKNPFALFPTPPVVIDYALAYTYAGSAHYAGRESVKILEPSAGFGTLIDPVVKDFAKSGIKIEVVCVEIDPINIQILKHKGYTVIEGDFLAQNELGLFDLICANPPFKGTEYVKHINHAQAMLADNGHLVTVAPTSLFVSTNKQALELKEKVAALNIGEFDDCIFEPGTFDNTDYETMLVTLPSIKATEIEMQRLEIYAAHLMALYVDNEQRLNTRLVSCKDYNEALGLANDLSTAYLSENPYAFHNARIEKLAMEQLASTFEHEPEVVETSHQEDSLTALISNTENTERKAPLVAKKSETQTDQIADLLTEIETTLTLRPTAPKTTRVLNKPVPSRKSTPQLEMSF